VDSESVQSLLMKHESCSYWKTQESKLKRPPIDKNLFEITAKFKAALPCMSTQTPVCSQEYSHVEIEARVSRI
jgi:hypothetical protein